MRTHLASLLLCVWLLSCGSSQSPKDVGAGELSLPADVADVAIGPEVVVEVTPDLSDAGAQPLEVIETIGESVPPPDLAEEIGSPPDGVPFAEGPYGITPFKTAGPFVVPTLAGEWDFEKEWSFGKDSYVFVNHAVGNAYVTELLSSSIKDLVKKSPSNVHYFFMSVDSKAADHAQAMYDKVQEELSVLEDWERVSWEPRLHFVTEPVHLLDNWLGDVTSTYTGLSFCIDRFQRFREVGLLSSIGGSEKLELRNLAYEVIYFNFEWTREQELAAQEEVTIVTVFEEELFGGNGFYETELPDAATMATFDTMKFDLTMGCKDKIDWNCGDWDYLANLYLCDVDDQEKCGTEIGRWITSYKRQGRWVTDVSGMLAHIKGGGLRRFRYDASGQSYLLTLHLRLSNTGKGMRPAGQQFLWNGGGFGLGYNNGHKPIGFHVPDWASRVEVFAYITGHGFGGDWANCAEFCNHTHHFSVNEGKEQVKEHPYAGTGTGCAMKVNEGVVPNQFGTWPFGRGGWCPGWDVEPFVADFTADVVDGKNIITYEGLHMGKDFDPSGNRGANIRMKSYLVYWAAEGAEGPFDLPAPPPEECNGMDDDGDGTVDGEGLCPEGESCFDGQCCPAAMNCEDKECGDDGCGGSCAECEEGFECVEHICTEVCIPDCEDKECGDDGCEGICAECEEGFECVEHVCVETPGGDE